MIYFFLLNLYQTIFYIIDILYYRDKYAYIEVDTYMYSKLTLRFLFFRKHVQISEFFQVFSFIIFYCKE